ncbi:signal transduction histidine kinase [Actinoplanes lutulentus]|nr:sensor histidine kinase [Actinoplanes lutulentus]MBB2947021.1 signal transduction histidine kinase [Actinoplanes lutulentus]
MDATVSSEPPRLLVTVVPYGLLGLLTVYTAASGRATVASLLLCGLTAVWMLGMFAWRCAYRSVLFVGLVLLTGLLVLGDPAFGFFTTAAYIYAFAFLPWPWRVPGVAAVAVVAGIAQASSVDKGDAAGWTITATIIAINMLIMTAMAAVLRREERVQADLGRANELLTASIAENDELHTRLLAQAREAGILQERQRMAREIHDTVAQGLTGIIAQMRAAEQRHEVPQEWRRPFDAVTRLARESLTEARRSVDALRPETLATVRLTGALSEAAERWSALHGLPVTVTTTGTPRPVAPDAEFALLRTAQEALANIAKHAEATRAGVTLSYLGDEVALDVLDDGSGFAVGGRSEGHGLTIMRQRVEEHGGTLRIESEPGAGTGISARIPLLPTGSQP